MKEPRILTFDIETSPIEGYVWDLYDQNIALNQIKEDWSILAFAAKWKGDKKVIYRDNRKRKNVRDDKKLVKALWKILDKADVVITQNGDNFDIKKFNARAIIHGLPPIRGFRSTDVMKESKKVFGFTSQSLEYTSNILNTKYKKLSHKKYPGMSLWIEVMKKNKSAWKEMETYCIHDVLSTEEKFDKIQAWIKTQNMACYYDDVKVRCLCGSTNIYKDGMVYTNAGKFQGYKCKDCGKRPKGKINFLSKDKKSTLLRDTTK